MYEQNNLGDFGGLGSVWGDVNSKETDKVVRPTDRIDASKLIPRKTETVNADQAAAVIKKELKTDRPLKAKKAKKQAQGDVFWTSNSGPIFSQQPLMEGKKAENVPPPKIVLKPAVKVIRDLPKLDLPPIPVAETPTPKAGIGDLGFLPDSLGKFKYVIFAGLGLIAALCIYETIRWSRLSPEEQQREIVEHAQTEMMNKIFAKVLQ